MTTLYMGRFCTMWPTYREARESWRMRREDLIRRREDGGVTWWRATNVVPVSNPADVDMRHVLKEDL